MIFILAAEIGDLDEWGLEHVHAIDKLAHCAFEGAHIIVAESLNVPKKLLTAPPGTFGSVTTAVLRKLVADFAFQGWLRESNLETAMVTTTGTIAEVKKRCPRVLSLSQIQSMSLEPTTLLAENVIDAKVYLIAAKHHICANKLKGVSVAAIARGGGGSTIVPELAEITERSDRICFALTDSDRAWPAAGQSDTSKKCHRLVNQANSPVGHESIPVRELENLIPPSVLFDLGGSPDHVDSVQVFADLCVEIPAVRECCDIKDGVCGSKVFGLAERTPEREFLGSLLVRRHGKDSRCVQEEGCEQEQFGGKCKCVCVPRVGPVAEKFHEWIEGRSSQKALEAFTPPWRDAWLSVGAMVFSWCCARPRMRG